MSRDVIASEEFDEFKRCISDIARLIKLAESWKGRDTTFIAQGLLDTLRSMMALDLVYLRLDGTEYAFIRTGDGIDPQIASEEISRALAPWVTTERPSSSTRLALGGMTLSVTAMRLGISADIGFLVAGSRRVGFPRRTEHLRLKVAASQATVAFREVRQLSDRALPPDANPLKPAERIRFQDGQRLEILVDALPVAVWSTTADGMAEFFNQHHLDYVGRRFEDLQGLGFLSQFHPHDLPRLLRIWQRMLESKKGGELEGRVRRADGEYRWTLMRTAPLLDESGNVFRWYGVNTDIEDRKRAEDSLTSAEAALVTSERNFRLMIDSLPILVWSARADGSAEYVNQHYRDYAGVSESDIVDWGYTSLVHPDDREGMISRWKDQLDQDWAVNQARLRRFDGEYFWFYFTGRKFTDRGGVVRWFGASIEIEDLKRAEDALRLNEVALRTTERRLQQIIGTVPGLVWSASPEGAANFFNQHYLDYVGRSADDLVGDRWTTAIHPDDVMHLVGTWRSMLESRRGGDDQARWRRADGQYRWFLFRTNPYFDNAGNLTHWFGINTDIDDRKRAEDRLREAQAELAHMTRMITVGELAVSIAHEVNQPLMAVVTNAATCLRWLEEGQQDVHQARQAAERVVRDGHRAGEIVASIRALARKSPPLIERMDIRKAVREVLELIRGELGRAGIEPTFDRSDTALEVLGDRTQLQQVALNLVVNGSEAMTDIPQLERRLHIDVSAGDDGFAEISVSDSGPGLDVGAVDRLFEAFYTTKPNGIGMGLSICRSIVEGHGGRIWATPNHPRGSMFHFTVPMALRTD